MWLTCPRPLCYITRDCIVNVIHLLPPTPLTIPHNEEDCINEPQETPAFPSPGSCWYIRPTPASPQDQLTSLLTGTADAGPVDAPVNEPQPTASQPEKPAATRSRKKKAGGTRQTKKKGAAAAKLEPVPPNETTLATSSNHAGGDGGESGSGPAACPPTPAPKKKAPPPPKQGTRASARIRGRNPTVAPEPTPVEPTPIEPTPIEPTPIEPKDKGGKRKRGPGDKGKDKAVEPPEKRPRSPDNQAETSAGAGVTIPNDGKPDDPVSNKSATADQVGQPTDDAAPEENEEEYVSPFTPEERARMRNRRFFIRVENGVALLGLGYVNESGDGEL